MAADDGAQKSIIDFSVINLDTVVFSVLMGVIGLFVMWRVAKSVSSGVPGRMQAAVEIVLEMVNEQAKVMGEVLNPGAVQFRAGKTVSPEHRSMRR